MAYVLLPAKLVRKSSFYSSFSPSSCLKDHPFVNHPNISSSFSSIYNYNNSDYSTTIPYRSMKNSCVNSANIINKSSHELLLKHQNYLHTRFVSSERVRYFSSEHNKDELFEDDDQYSWSKCKELFDKLHENKKGFFSPHIDFMTQLPKELSNVTLEKFHEATKFFFISMGILSVSYFVIGIISLSFSDGTTGNVSLGPPASDFWAVKCVLQFCLFTYAGLREIRAMPNVKLLSEKLKLLRKRQEKGNLKILVFQVLKEVERIYERSQTTMYTFAGIDIALFTIFLFSCLFASCHLP